ncbi:MAG: hypothetical protein LV479_09305 [Methylacidiphilales bacterium]|nr:hypothetical protein [Candidatus Methylacidiphilales bacterium]
MALSHLDFRCLISVADDYESVTEIKRMLKNRDGLNVMDEEIVTSLSRLVKASLVTAYVYDPAQQQYILAPNDQHERAKKWFWITSAGLEYLNKNQPFDK